MSSYESWKKLHAWHDGFNEKVEAARRGEEIPLDGCGPNELAEMLVSFPPGPYRDLAFQEIEYRYGPKPDDVMHDEIMRSAGRFKMKIYHVHANLYALANGKHRSHILGNPHLVGLFKSMNNPLGYLEDISLSMHSKPDWRPGKGSL